MKDIDVDNNIKWNNRALNYDRSIRTNFFRNIQSKAVDSIDLKPGMTFLDLGCGTGWAVYYAYEKTKSIGTYYGIDISDKMIQISKDKFRDLHSIKFVQSSAEDIDLPSNSIDRVICTNSFHHYKDPIKVLLSIKRILKPNGQFLIADVTTDSTVARLLNKILKLTETGHVSFYSSQEYKDMFQTVGLKLKIKQDIYSILKYHISEKI